jgi:signal transduction histidine kinase
MRNSFFVFVGVFCCSFSAVFAQRQEIDSLKKVLPKYAESDTNYINTLNELAFAHYSINPDTTFVWAAKALMLANQSRYDKGKMEALRNQGIAAVMQGNYARSLQLYAEALSLAKKISNKIEIANLHNNIAIVYHSQGNYPEALENHFKSLKVREEMRDRRRIAGSLNNIANIYTDQGEYAEALENHFKSLKIKEEIGDKRGIGNSLSNISIIYSYQGKYAEALENDFKSLKISEEIGDKQGIALSLSNIATVYEKQNKHAEALENFFKSLKIFEEIGDEQEMANTKNGLAKVYLALKNYAQALKYAQEGLGTAKEMGQKVVIRDLNESLSKTYKAMGKYELALVHHEQFKNYADSLNNAETEKKTATLQAQYEFDKKTTLMQAEQAKKDSEQEKQRNQLYWLVFSALAGLVSLSIILFLISRSRKKIQNAYGELAISNVQVQQVKEEIEAQAEELQRLNHFKDRLFSIIAHDLRSPMAALKGTLGLLDPGLLNKSELEMLKDDLIKQFGATDKILQDLLQWTKDQMKGETIHPVTLDIHEMANEKINLLAATAQHKNIALSSGILPETKVFADANHVNIILQNLLSNALKFTYAGGAITITSQNMDKMVQITVKDTGQGMSGEQQNKLFSAQYFTTKGTAGEKGNGLGLNLVKSLVEKNGGRIWVKSEEGKGSEFCFLLPVGPDR